jgi:hypothetical protein
MTIESQRDKIRQRQKMAADYIDHLPILSDAAEVHTAFDDRALKLHDRIR